MNVHFMGIFLISGLELLLKPAGKRDIKRCEPCDSRHLLTNWFLSFWSLPYFVLKNVTVNSTFNVTYYIIYISDEVV